MEIYKGYLKNKIFPKVRVFCVNWFNRNTRVSMRNQISIRIILRSLYILNQINRGNMKYSYNI